MALSARVSRTDRAAVAAALDQLVDLNWLRADEQPKRRGRPTVIYEVNPKVQRVKPEAEEEPEPGEEEVPW